STFSLPRESHHVGQECLALRECGGEGGSSAHLLVSHLLQIDGVDECLKLGKRGVESIRRGILSVRVHDGMLSYRYPDRAEETEHSANIINYVTHREGS
ncbi:hypothetical protein PMAYCL1PPCAC_10967, partial [Pristionchus mayeri]